MVEAFGGEKHALKDPENNPEFMYLKTKSSLAFVVEGKKGDRLG